MTPIYKNALSKAAIISLALLLTFMTGCSQKQRIAEKSTDQLNTTFSATQTPEELIGWSLITSEPEKSQLLLQAALIYWNSNLTGQSKAALDTVIPASLHPKALLDYLDIKQQIAIFEMDHDALTNLLPLYDLAINQSSVEEQVKAINQKLNIYDFLGAYTQKAILLAESSGLFDIDALEELPEQIWQTLRLADTQDLLQYRYNGQNYDVLGWLELAQTFKLNQSSLDLQLSAITTWMNNWPLHPAATTPPREIKVLQSLPSIKPKQITLALPLSGSLANAGKAVRDGFVAEFYKQNTMNQDNETRIHFFDTHSNDIASLYAQQHEDNALIVGPLDKASLNTLSQFDALPVTTLALNNIHTSQVLDDLYQFTLQPEAGVEQIAKRLIKKSLKRVLVISPEAEWGLRIHDTFAQHFSKLNGLVIDSIFYQNQSELSSKVSQLLGTLGSNERFRSIRNLTKLNLHNEARRRQDIDAIFMIAKPQTAKLLKPLFAFHYAADIPVFSTSQIHDPNSSNKDLNGIEFVEMPWMLSSTDFTKNQIKSLLPSDAETFSRFYALGSDAYKLSPRLKLLTEIPGSNVEGQTGLLSLNDRNEISRELQWAKFYRGKAIAIQE